MQSLDGLNDYTRDQVLDALRGVYGSRRLEFRYELLDSTNKLIGNLGNVLSGTISYEGLADIKRTARFALADDGRINFLKDRIKVWARLYMPDVPVSGALRASVSYQDALERVTGLLARWKLDEALGTVLADFSGNERSLTASGATLNQSGLVDDGGRAISLSPGTQIATSDGSFLNSLTTFTIGGWFKSNYTGRGAALVSTTSGPTWGDFLGGTWNDMSSMTWAEVADASGQGTWASISSGTWEDLLAFTWGDLVRDVGGISVRCMPDANNISATVTISGQQVVATTPTNTQTMDRTFFAMSWRSGGQLVIYLNGEPVAESAPSSAVIGALAGVKDLVLGGSNFGGVLDDWFVSSSVIPPAIVRDLYVSGVRPGGDTPRNSYVEWPQGVFLLSSPTQSTDGNSFATHDVEAYDQLVILQSQLVDRPFYVAAGELYTDAIVELLGNTPGIAGYTVVPSVKTLPAMRMWDAGTSHLRIVNDLCGSINYEGMYFDEHGQGVIRPYVAPQERDPEYVYDTSNVSVMLPAASKERDLYDQPNKWVLTVSEPDRPPLTAVYVNEDPGNPTSTINRGRVITRYETEQDAADQEVLDAKVRWLAQEATQIYETVDFSTAIMPFHSHRDVYRISYPQLQVEGDYSETQWSYDLQAGSDMQHKARRVVVLDDYVPPPPPPDEEEPPPDIDPTGSIQSENNVCGNPRLVTDASGWGTLAETYTGARIPITTHVQATHAFEVTTAGVTASPGIYLPQQGGVNENEQWTFAMDMQADVAGTGRVAVDWYDALDNFIGHEDGPEITLVSNVWKRVELTFTAPPGVGTGGHGNVTAYATLANSNTKWRITLADYVQGVTLPPPTGSDDHGINAVKFGWTDKLVLRDEFEGSSVNTSIWSMYDSVGHDGKGLRRPAQFTVSNSILKCYGTTNGTTGGMAMKVGRQKYGRWECRMRSLRGDSRYHPVLLTWPDSENWPIDGEIDFSEGKCGVNKVEFFLHFGANNSQTYGFINVDITQWHDWAVEWTPTSVKGWCDGVQFFSDTNASHFNFGSHHLCIQLDWFPAGASTTGDGEMEVDWARVYSL
ncbi:MAG: glycoside hydrolase family 16 protein [Pseudonocardia sp.]|nr:glycoside hydrolase family 16 protein [Pseudonocardia sp.]